MSFHKFIDEEIKKAIEAGEFDNLEGAGRPLDLTSYFNTPEEFRMGYSVLKSSKFVPEEVERLKEIGELKEKIANCKNDEEKIKLKKVLQERELAFAILMERNKTRKR
jgi:hypothetical protein